MATLLPCVNEKVVLRCDLCFLVQFASDSRNCRRCRMPLDSAPEPMTTMARTRMPLPLIAAPPSQLGATVKFIRLQRGWSQKALGRRFNLPRTYVSKIETGRTSPTLSTLERLARALEVSIPALLDGDERRRRERIDELLMDGYVAQFLPFVTRLTEFQRQAILTQTKNLARHAA
ncbi:MAG: helix-turn-helix transcriptional regulator [Candidatus Sulfotelmatobacter sp.]